MAAGIVVAAVSSALAGWRSEIFVEYAGQKEALSRQDLAGQQLGQRIDQQLVESDARRYASYEQDRVIADQFQQESSRAIGRPAATLRMESQNDRALADLVLPFAGNGVVFSNTGQVSFNPETDYASRVLYDPVLGAYNSFELTMAARESRNDAVPMAAVAVLFVVALAFLTLSEMMLRRKRPAGSRRWSIGRTLAAAAVAVWSVGAVLFAILYAAVPRLM